MCAEIIHKPNCMTLAAQVNKREVGKMRNFVAVGVTSSLGSRAVPQGGGRVI